MARRQVAVERTASERDSMAVGEGEGAVKPWMVVEGGRVGVRDVRHVVVMVGVELGFMRRINMGRGGGVGFGREVIDWRGGVGVEEGGGEGIVDW